MRKKSGSASRFFLGIVGVTALLFCSSTIAGAKKQRNLPPRDLVARYLESDFQGSRLQKDTQAPTATTVTWDSEPDDNRFIVTRDFSVGTMKIRRGVAKVQVKFQNLGELKGNVYFPDNLTEQATFEVVKRKGRWVIDRPILMPHVSGQVAEKFLNERLAKLTQGSEDATAVQLSLETIQKQTAPRVVDKGGKR